MIDITKKGKDINNTIDLGRIILAIIIFILMIVDMLFMAHLIEKGVMSQKKPIVKKGVLIKEKRSMKELIGKNKTCYFCGQPVFGEISKGDYIIGVCDECWEND